MEFLVPYFIITINFPKENIKFGGSWYNFVLQHQAHYYYFLDASDLTKEEKVNISEALFWNIILL